MFEWLVFFGCLAFQGLTLLLIAHRMRVARRQELLWRAEYAKLFADHQNLLASHEARLHGLGSRSGDLVPTWEELQTGKYLR